MNVLIADDHPLVRNGLLAMLSVDENIESVFEASNIAEAMEGLSRNRVDIAMIDLRLGIEDGLDVVKMARERGMQTKHIILTSSMKKGDFLRARECGVEGYILKQAYAEDIIYALHVVERNRKYYDPEIMERVEEKKKSGLNELTNREMEIARVLGEGLDNAQIAKKLFISQNTVKKHISNILSKLDMTHRTQIAIYANSEMADGEDLQKKAVSS